MSNLESVEQQSYMEKPLDGNGLLYFWQHLKAMLSDMDAKIEALSGGGGGGGGVNFTTDETLTLSPDSVLSVNTADVVEEDNTLPVTSAAVQITVGNIDELLKTI